MPSSNPEIRRYRGKDAFDALKTPFFDAIEEERRMFLPDGENLPRQIGPLEPFFADVIEKHHGTGAYFDDWDGDDGSEP